MAVFYTLLQEPNVFIHKYVGPFSIQQQAQLFEAKSQYAFEHGSPDSLSDLSDLTDFQVSGGEMMDVAHEISKFLGRAPSTVRFAFYAPTDLGFGLARMFEGFLPEGSNIQVRIFDDLKDAMAWLDVPGTPSEVFDTSNWAFVAD
ncbi:MAG: hypothetical protein N4A61_14320 [Pelagimonas sp.]|jgi:hypothetical protein|nr:hypothetical protein [Pelagimonas sp.]